MRSSGCSRGASIPDDEQSAQPRVNPACGRRAPRPQVTARAGRRAGARRARRRADIERRGPPGAHRGRGRLHRARARGDAPGDAALHVASARPVAQKRRPDSVPPRSTSAPRRRRRDMVRVDGGRATLGADARRDAPFGWDNEFGRRCVVDVPAFDIDVYNVTNADFLAFVDAGGYDDERWWTREGWALARRARRDASAVLGARRRASGWLWRGHVRARAAAAGLARLRQPRRGRGLRALARRAAADRGRVPSRGVRHARRAPSARHPWGDGDARRDARPLRLRQLRSGAGRQSHPAGASAWGVEDLVGNGWEWTSTVFGPFPGLRGAMPSYPEYSADFFDGEHYVMKGASPVTARELIRPTFRNWFRATLSLRLRDVPLRARAEARAHDGAHGPRAAAGRRSTRARSMPCGRGYLSLRPKRLSPSTTSTTSSGSALFDAICRLPWYRGDAGRAAAARSATPPILVRAAAPAFVAELGPRQRREAGGARRAPRVCASEPPDRAPDRRLAGGARRRLAHAGQRWRTVRARHAPRRRPTTTGSISCAPHRPASAARSCCSSARTSATSIRPTAAALLARIRRALAPGDYLLLGADLVKPEAELLPRLRRSAGRHRGVQSQPAGAASTASSAPDFDLAAFEHRAPLERGGVARRDAPRERSSASASRFRGARLRDRPSRAGESIWTESSYKVPARRHLVHGHARRLRPARALSSTSPAASRWRCSKGCREAQGRRGSEAQRSEVQRSIPVACVPARRGRPGRSMRHRRRPPGDGAPRRGRGSRSNSGRVRTGSSQGFCLSGAGHENPPKTARRRSSSASALSPSRAGASAM